MRETMERIAAALEALVELQRAEQERSRRVEEANATAQWIDLQRKLHDLEPIANDPQHQGRYQAADAVMGILTTRKAIEEGYPEVVARIRARAALGTDVFSGQAVGGGS